MKKDSFGNLRIIFDVKKAKEYISDKNDVLLTDELANTIKDNSIDILKQADITGKPYF